MTVRRPVLVTSLVVGSLTVALLPNAARGSASVRAQTAGAPERRSDARAEVLLGRAAQALGGSAALDAVRSLRLHRHDGQVESILFPDRSQIVMKRRSGTSISTLDGDRFWTRRPKGAGTAAPVLPVVRSPQEILQSARRRIAWDSVKYLLRAPSHYPMQKRHAGRVTFGPVSGEAVQFTPPDGPKGFVVFQDEDGLPKALITEIALNPDVQGTRLIEVLHDYQKVGAILAPSRIATYRLRGARTETLAEWRFTIEVNPPLTAADFREPKER